MKGKDLMCVLLSPVLPRPHLSPEMKTNESIGNPFEIQLNTS